MRQRSARTPADEHLISAEERCVFIIEQNEIFRYLLGLITDRAPDLVMKGTARSGPEGLHALSAMRAAPDSVDSTGGPVDLVVVNLELPEMDGLEVVRRLSRMHPGLPCLVASVSSEPYHVRAALKAGAKGYLMLTKPTDLAPAIRRVLDGDVYLSPGLHYGC